MTDKNQHPSFKTDEEGHHYTPGQSRGNASYFEKPAPPVRDAGTGHPIGSNGDVDWGRVIQEANNESA